MEFEDLASINSEIRFITLELMKLAAQRGVSFDEVLDEFLQNATVLRTGLRTGAVPASKTLSRVHLGSRTAAQVRQFKASRK